MADETYNMTDGTCNMTDETINETIQQPIGRMNIVTALNSKYVRYAYVMLTSLFQNNSEAEIFVFLLHSGLTSSEQEVLTALGAKYRQTVSFIKIDRGDFPTSLPTTQMWSLETYFRLKLLDVIPEEIDRLLYLDVDMIIDKPLYELYTADFEGAFFCVCRDMSAVLPFPDSRNNIFQEQIRGGDFTYFNAGMMLWNIDELRGRYCFEDYMRLAEELDYRMVAPDQDLLNFMHWKQVKFLDEYKYNLFSKMAYNHDVHYEDVKRETCIIHFAGMKPWEGEYIHYDIEKLWWNYAKLTPFYAELLEEFVLACLTVPTVYNTMLQMMNEKNDLQAELAKSRELCQKLYTLIDR